MVTLYTHLLQYGTCGNVVYLVTDFSSSKRVKYSNMYFDTNPTTVRYFMVVRDYRL